MQADYSYASPGYNTSVSLVLSQMKSASHFKLDQLRTLMMAVLQHPATGITHTHLCYRNEPDCMFWPDASAYLSGTCCMEGYLCHRHHTHTCATGMSQIACSDHMLLHILAAPAVWRDTSATGIIHIPVLQERARLHVPAICFCISYQHLRQYPILAPLVRYPQVVWEWVCACACV